MRRGSYGLKESIFRFREIRCLWPVEKKGERGYTDMKQRRRFHFI